MNARKLATYAWGVVVFNLLVIQWGAVVRITGSGAGCGSHWPLCNGEVVPLGGGVSTAIEFAHRATSGLALLAVVALVVLVHRVFERGHPARLGAVLAITFMLLEAALGAGLVLFDLVVDNDSVARAIVMAIHLVNTFALLAGLALTARWAGGAAPVRLRDRGDRLQTLALTALGSVLLVGATGAVTALGDTLFPADSLKEGLAQDFAPGAHFLVQLRFIHPLIAILVGISLVLAASKLRAVGRPDAQAWSDRLVILVFLQLVAGVTNFLLRAPMWIQLVHLLLADLLWISLVLACAAALAAEPEPDSA